MKKFNKGMVISTTIAAALAAVTLAGCGSVTEAFAPKAVPASINETVKDAVDTSAKVGASNSAAPAAAATDAAETKAEEKTETAKETKKTTKKATKKNTKKNKKKSSKKTTTTAAQQTQPAQPVVIIQQPAQQTQQVQPAQTTQKTETPKKKAKKEKKANPVVIPETYTPIWVDGDVYAGTYSENRVGIGYMEISNIGNNYYAVHIGWDCDSDEYNTWDFVGEFNGRGAMNYTGCIKNNHVYNNKGGENITTVYTNGTGWLEFKDEGVVTWTDNMGDILPGTKFTSYKPYTENKKSDEVGTAGSRYYDNETKANKKSDEVGTAGSNYYDYDNMPSFIAGSFIEKYGSRVSLDIVKMGNGAYDCTVRAADSAFANYQYHFIAYHNTDDMLTYDGGYVTYQEYDEDGNLVCDEVISYDHSGSVIMNIEGIDWYDSDGTQYVFVGC